ncbi:MAG: restriction endonuclease subunit S [Fibrobacteraceae bacterium]|nr:restriction endonuclease subunit S [Fibrobacteraceae bacterium]
MSKTEWKEYKLGEIYEVHNGLSKGREFFGSGYPFISFSTVFNKWFIPEIITDFAQTTESEQESYSIKAGDILVTRTSETADELGMSCVALRDIPNATYNGFCKRMRQYNKDVDVDSKYVGYYMRNPEFRKKFQAFAGSMSTRASLTNDALLGLTIKLPPLAEQQRIAKILSSLDDKIELNNAINRNLEEQAQAIFKNWFIDFEPFGGKMPEDWKNGSLSDIADYLNGLAMQKFRPKNEEVGLPVLKIKELRQGFAGEDAELCSPNIKSEYIVNDGDVIFSWSGSLLVDLWCGGKCGLNQHLFKVTSERYDKWFYYMWTKHHLDRFIFLAADKATTMGHIKREELDKAEVCIPTKADYNKIGSSLEPMIETIIAKRVENQRLTLLRNKLLPKLMSNSQ